MWVEGLKDLLLDKVKSLVPSGPLIGLQVCPKSEKLKRGTETWLRQ